MSMINKDDLILALSGIGLTFDEKSISNTMTFKNDKYRFEINVNFQYYVRYPTGNRTEVKFKDINELVSKIKKFFSNNHKKAEKEKNILELKNKKEKLKNDKFNELCNNPYFKKINGEFYYKEHVVIPRLSKDNIIYFRVIISGEIKDITPENLIDLHNFIDNNL